MWVRAAKGMSTPGREVMVSKRQRRGLLPAARSCWTTALRESVKKESETG